MVRSLRGAFQHKTALLVAWAQLAISTASVAQDSSDPIVPSERISFNRHIRTILSDKCFFCHGPDANRREADLRLDIRDSAIAASAIVPGEPEHSELLVRITSKDEEVRMPPLHAKLPPVSEQEAELIRRWIAEGAEYEQHWSFEPLVPVHSDQPSRDFIDLPIREELQRRGKQPQQTASRETLIRRLSFDLTGLPPSTEEVRAFITDDREDAYERLVDRLLQSEHFGERWATDWLDVARYADSFGFQVDRDRDVWVWRDWVIQAFQTNMPFDQFLTWQLAGDLLPHATRDQVLATAFNRLHQQEAEGGSVEEEYRVEYVCDRVQTFATAFLGLTFECARCHDHKFDPITQRDYYGLFAMFQNIDEAGLYSYFTLSPPTPTLALPSEIEEARCNELQKAVCELEKRSEQIRAERRSSFDERLRDERPSHSSEQAEETISTSSDPRGASWLSLAQANEIARLSFDEIAGDRFTNQIREDQPAFLRGENQLVDGRFGKAVEFTGDDPVDLSIGNFGRHQAFSVSLWLSIPSHYDRAVVFHRSRAWTDAASRGYELLILDGRLQWSLIHFWPGNAISIASKDVLTTNDWHHVVVTYDGSSRASGLSIYIDGKLASTEVVKDSLTKEITGGGGDNIAIGERFRDRGLKKGKIDEFRVFQSRLVELEVLSLFDSEASQSNVTFAHRSLDATSRDQRYNVYLERQDEVWRQHLSDLEKARLELFGVQDAIAEMMVMEELPKSKPAFILVRGEYDKRGDAVEAATPAFLPPMPDDLPKNRLGLAKWLTSSQHPLTARVTVNRFWQSIFGMGLVRTSEDFGSQGSKPIYQNVLDRLAFDFIDHGWDIKRLLKIMVMSETYRQRSVSDRESMIDDPENEWLARGPRFRLSAEMIRDQALAVSGLLDRSIGGPPVYPFEMTEAFRPATVSSGSGAHRRSLYTRWQRTSPPPAMLTFDAPRRAVCIAKRERTDTPLQAMVLLNGVQHLEAARKFAERLCSNPDLDQKGRVEEAFLACLSRLPSEGEIDIVSRLLQEQRQVFERDRNAADRYTSIGVVPRDNSIDIVELAAYTTFVQMLFAHDEAVVKR